MAAASFYSARSPGRIGIVNVNVEPAPTALLTQISPPCSPINFRDRANPSPVPSTFLSAVPTCRNSSNTASGVVGAVIVEEVLKVGEDAQNDLAFFIGENVRVLLANGNLWPHHQVLLTHRQRKCPTLAHLGQLGHPIAASGRNVAQRSETRTPGDRSIPCYSCSRNLRTRSMRGWAS
jgi:hypothetical protein